MWQINRYDRRWRWKRTDREWQESRASRWAPAEDVATSASEMPQAAAASPAHCPEGGEALQRSLVASGSVQPPKAKAKPPPPLPPPGPSSQESRRNPRDMDELSSASTNDMIYQGPSSAATPGVESSSSSGSDNEMRHRGLFTELPLNHPRVTIRRYVDETTEEAVTDVIIVVQEPCRLQMRISTPLPDDGPA